MEGWKPIVIAKCTVVSYTYNQGLREKFFQGVRRSTPDPQKRVKNLQINQRRSSLRFGPIFCPKLGEEQKKKIFTQIWSHILPKSQGQMKSKVEKKFCLKLDATTSTLPGPLSPGTMYPLNPPLAGPAYNHVIARAGFTLSWAHGTLGFSQYFSAKYR